MIMIFMYATKRSRFHCKCPIKNKKNSLLALIFKQIAPNLAESVCAPCKISTPNLSSIDATVFEL